MAIQVETPAQVAEISTIFRRRKWWFLVPVLFAFGVGALATVLLPEQYEVETQVKLFDIEYSREDFWRSKGSTGAFLRSAENAEYEIKEPSRLHGLLDELGFTDFQELDFRDRQDYVEKVRDNIDVKVLPKAKDVGPTYFELSFKDVDGERAERFLRALTERWVVEQFEGYKEDLGNNLSAERDIQAGIEIALKAANEEFQDKIAKNVFPHEASRRNRPNEDGDALYDRLQNYENKIKELEIDLELLAVERQEKLDEIDGIDPYTYESTTTEASAPRDDTSLPLLLTSLDRAQSELAKWRPGSASYQRIKQQVQELESKIAARTGTPDGTGTPETRRTVKNPELADKQEELADIDRRIALEERQLELLRENYSADRRAYVDRTAAAHEVQELEKKISNLEADLKVHAETISQFERDLQYLASQGPSYEVTKEPLAPEKPSEPNVPLVMVGSFLIGAVLGTALLLGREYVVPGFRISADAASNLTVPILGIVSRVTTRRQRASERVLATVTAASTLLFLAMVAWFLWAWNTRQELLGTDLTEFIEGIQYSLR
ncbi:MAG: hypothetical protein R3F34_02830 [Planctomycetota bacterium]